MKRFAVAVLLAIQAAAMASAAEPPEAQRYAACMDLARRNPERGWESALAWGSLGGGEPARHCGAVALIGLGHYEEAATRLEQLAKDSRGEPTLRAAMLGQAARAWMRAKQLERAQGTLDGAVTLAPDDADLRIDRAMLRAERRDFAGAVADLDHVLQRTPRRVDALVLRAAARRNSNDTPGAERDVRAALEVEPNNLDALLESGILHAQQGNRGRARQDWRRILELAPDSAVADMARGHIEAMEIGGRSD